MPQESVKQQPEIQSSDCVLQTKNGSGPSTEPCGTPTESLRHRWAFTADFTLFLYSYNINTKHVVHYIPCCCWCATFKPQPPVPILYFIHCSSATYLCVLCFESELVEMRDRPDVVLSDLALAALYKLQMWHKGDGGGILLNST